MVLPKANASEASYIAGTKIIAVDSLNDAVGYLRGEKHISPYIPKVWNAQMCKYKVDFRKSKGSMEQSGRRRLQLPAGITCCLSARLVQVNDDSKANAHNTSKPYV